MSPRRDKNQGMYPGGKGRHVATTDTFLLGLLMGRVKPRLWGRVRSGRVRSVPVWSGRVGSGRVGSGTWASHG